MPPRVGRGVPALDQRGTRWRAVRVVAEPRENEGRAVPRPRAEHVTCLGRDGDRPPLKGVAVEKGGAHGAVVFMRQEQGRVVGCEQIGTSHVRRNRCGCQLGPAIGVRVVQRGFERMRGHVNIETAGDDREPTARQRDRTHLSSEIERRRIQAAPSSDRCRARGRYVTTGCRPQRYSTRDHEDQRDHNQRQPASSPGAGTARQSDDVRRRDRRGRALQECDEIIHGVLPRVRTTATVATTRSPDASRP